MKFYDLNEDIKQKKDLEISVKIALQSNMRNMSGSLDSWLWKILFERIVEVRRDITIQSIWPFTLNLVLVTWASNHKSGSVFN
jgi:hypothetical protein